MTQNPAESKTGIETGSQPRQQNEAAQPGKTESARDLDVDAVNRPASGSLPFWRVLISVFQAAFGVQSRENKERDFAEGKLLPFIVAAILFTVLFVGVLLLVVSLVL